MVSGWLDIQQRGCIITYKHMPFEDLVKINDIE